LVFGKILAHISAGLVASLLKQQSLQSQVEAMRTLSRAQTGPFVSKNISMEKMADMARRIASTDLSVVIQGESGVGKEVLARWIHNSSSQSKGPFVAINCGAIPEGLIESQLFGHQKGACTGAVSDSVGKFVQANHGTIFLDEVADLPLTTQVKLLRVLQEKVVEPLGSTRTSQVQVRVLCASHKNLRKLVAGGKFRQDLYYRLADVELEIPPLRDRIDDIAIITMQYFAETGCQKKLSKSALDWLRKQQRPGNVRELLSTLRRAMALSIGDEIHSKDFVMGTPSQHEETDWLGGPDLETARDLFVYSKVQRALQLTLGHRGQTAELLGITTRTLFRYLDEMKSKGIDVTNLSVDRKDLSP
jgi:DNA-binding NtrC family response regulator